MVLACCKTRGEGGGGGGSEGRGTGLDGQGPLRR